MRFVNFLILFIFCASIALSRVNNEANQSNNLSIETNNFVYKSNASISSICYSNISGNDGNSKTQVIKEIGNADNESMSYSILGITQGFPGGLNVFYGYQAKENYNLRLEIGYAQVIYGCEADLGYNIYRNKDFDTNIGVGAGITSESSGNETEIIPFIAFKANICFTGLFLEFGYCFMTEDRESIYYQLGYAFRI